MLVNNYVKHVRQKLNISRYKLAKDTGLSYVGLINIEKGLDVKLSTLYVIAKALKVHVKELVSQEN